MQNRRIPTQERSRKKFEGILSAAKILIGERGNDSVSMREIAKKAMVPPSSIYQYFPDKNSILTEIMQFYYEQVRYLFKELVLKTNTIDEFIDGLGDVIEIGRAHV